jgi:hypothetical protein
MNEEKSITKRQETDIKYYVFALKIVAFEVFSSKLV